MRKQEQMQENSNKQERNEGEEEQVNSDLCVPHHGHEYTVHKKQLTSHSLVWALVSDLG